LGKNYFNGDGVIQNDKTAFTWYSLAAEQGLDLAQNNLGVMYHFGFGVLTDYKKAYMWYNIAASNGSNAAVDGKITIAKSMNSSQIDKAQDMSNRCLGSEYTDC
jgi:TPR repeat protein